MQKVVAAESGKDKTRCTLWCNPGQRTSALAATSSLARTCRGSCRREVSTDPALQGNARHPPFQLTLNRNEAGKTLKLLNNSSPETKARRRREAAEKIEEKKDTKEKMPSVVKQRGHVRGTLEGVETQQRRRRSESTWDWRCGASQKSWVHLGGRCCFESIINNEQTRS